jgi:hypothetical protein
MKQRKVLDRIRHSSPKHTAQESIAHGTRNHFPSVEGQARTEMKVSVDGKDQCIVDLQISWFLKKNLSRLFFDRTQEPWLPFYEKGKLSRKKDEEFAQEVSAREAEDSATLVLS